MIIARDGARPIAASLLLQDGERLYGRYWGAIAQVPMLHFETCYYQPIEYAIEHGLRVIEGGAQGEHKMARGFEPVATVSAHWLAEPAFSDAVERFLGREGQAVGAYLDELNERTPFRTSA
jgi:predicted N-acyltransferase